MTYGFDPAYPDAESLFREVEIGAYGTNYYVANKGQLITLGISYHLPVNLPPLEAITLYNNYGYYNKEVIEYDDSHMNVLGGMVTARPMYIYVDSPWGYSHPWVGPEWTYAFSKGSPANTRLNMRFTVNMGVLF